MSVGASNDIERATQMARDMVNQYGMSTLGPRSFPTVERETFTAWATERPIQYSEELLSKLDNETNRIITEQYERAKKLLLEHKHEVELVAKELIEKETIESDEFEQLLSQSHEQDTTLN
jgi:cell division protease FtsH